MQHSSDALVTPVRGVAVTPYLHHALSTAAHPTPRTASDAPLSHRFGDTLNETADTVSFRIPADHELASPAALTRLAKRLSQYGLHRDFDPTLPGSPVEPGVVYGTENFPTATLAGDPLAALARTLSTEFPDLPWQLHSDPVERHGEWALGTLYRHHPDHGLHPAPGERVACDGQGVPYFTAEQILAHTARSHALESLLATAWTQPVTPPSPTPARNTVWPVPGVHRPPSPGPGSTPHR